MHVVRRLVVSLLCCLALGAGMLAVAPAGPARAADSAACTQAKAATAKAAHNQAVTKTRLVKAKKALAKAKRHHRKAKIAKARKLVHQRTRQHNRAVTALRNARANQSKACASTGGGGGGGTTTPDPAAGLGTLLALLTAGSNGGAVPAMDLTQLTGLLDGLYPGASSSLSPTQLTSILSSFGSASSLDPAALTSLLAGLPGASSLDPTQLVGLLSGGSLDQTALTSLLTTMTGSLGDLGPTGLSNPADPLSVITSVLGSLTTDPSQALGTLLGLLAAAGNNGSIPSLGTTQFTSLINGLYPGASTALGSTHLVDVLSAFPAGGSMDVTQLTSLLTSLGASGIDPTQLLAVLNGSSLSSGQATALTGEITSLLSSISGTSFTSPANPVATVGSLLQSILGGVLCGLLSLC